MIFLLVMPKYFGIYWYIKNECIRLFCNEQKKELAILHSKECEDENPCSDVPPNFKNEVTVKDVNGMVHLHASPNIENNTVEWNFLKDLSNLSAHMAEPDNF